MHSYCFPSRRRATARTCTGRRPNRCSRPYVSRPYPDPTPNVRERESVILRGRRKLYALPINCVAAALCLSAIFVMISRNSCNHIQSFFQGIIAYQFNYYILLYNVISLYFNYITLYLLYHFISDIAYQVCVFIHCRLNLSTRWCIILSNDLKFARESRTDGEEKLVKQCNQKKCGFHALPDKEIYSTEY